MFLCLTLHPSLPHTDQQRELESSVLQAAAPVQLTEEVQKIQQEAAAAATCVYNKHVLATEEGSVQPNTKAAASISLHFIPVKPPDSPVTSDVFQLAPFKLPAKEGKMADIGASFSASHKPAEASDVFLQAPFGRRQETTKVVSGNARTFQSGTQHIQAMTQSHLAPVSSPSAARPPYVHMETPLLQQPVAVHRVVSRIGQQAAVGSVAVGPLHAWTIGGRALEDPFTAAPFQPKCSQGKP